VTAVHWQSDAAAVIFANSHADRRCDPEVRPLTHLCCRFRRPRSRLQPRGGLELWPCCVARPQHLLRLRCRPTILLRRGLAADRRSYVTSRGGSRAILLQPDCIAVAITYQSSCCEPNSRVSDARCPVPRFVASCTIQLFLPLERSGSESLVGCLCLHGHSSFHSRKLIKLEPDLLLLNNAETALLRAPRRSCLVRVFY
jgi:hypothetical protein